jgi:hypothetical protein
MKRSWLPIMLVMLFVLIPAMAIGASFTGSIQGFNCVTQGKTCPVGKEDPVIAAESVFVLLSEGAANVFYFVPNLDRGIMARHINESVKIVGTMTKNLNSINAKELYVMKGGKYKKVWDINIQDEIYKDIWGTLPLGSGAAD